MKATFIAAALTAAILSMAPTGNANAADDYKMYAGSGCKVFGSTAWTDLQFGAAGIINLTNNPKNIICPLVKDSEVLFDGDAGVPVNSASVHLHIANGPVAAQTVCNVYVMENNSTYGGVVETTSVSTGVMGAGVENNFTASGLNGATVSNHTSTMMLCTLGPRAILRYYYFYEQGATEN